MRILMRTKIDAETNSECVAESVPNGIPYSHTRTFLKLFTKDYIVFC